MVKWIGWDNAWTKLTQFSTATLVWIMLSLQILLIPYPSNIVKVKNLAMLPKVIEKEGHLMLQSRPQGRYISDITEPSDIEKEDYLIVQPMPQGSYISDDGGSLEALASSMMDRGHDKRRPAHRRFCMQ
ncbi:uncharacterized protein LOC120132218 [Hibiscus syriacus]|uniref:uncharacterized protein LOC120132218 n=1 Tax=Hibiscus syriacus TaxID=106335 RepID=UPI0019239027|nr:uncharacterized protein LOC120132218 [Hibiscus syriacus]